jgi:hypothetical protein
MEGEAGGSPSIARERVRSSPRPIGHVWVYLVAVCAYDACESREPRRKLTRSCPVRRGCPHLP